jgi:hypothetical protein
MFWVSNSLFFGDEGEEGDIECREDLTRSPEVLNDFPKFLPYHGPIVVEKIRCEAIRPRRFSFWSVLERQVYFLNRDRSHRCFILLLSNFGWDVLSDFSNGMRSVPEVRKEILIKGYQLLLQVVVRMESLAFFRNYVRDAVDMSSLNHRSMEELGVSISLL